MNRLRAWYAYDFGNSAFAVLFPAVYGAWYADTIVGGARGTAWWGYTQSTSMLLVALSAPLLGGIADHAGRRRRLLALYTAVGVATVLAFTTVDVGMVWTGFVLGALANLCFEGGIVFYNAYLPDLAPAEMHGRVSARGFAIGYVGSLVALAAAAMFAAPRPIWIACALQWGLVGAWAIRRLPKDRPTGVTAAAAARDALRHTRATLKDVLGRKDLRRFLGAYFFYMDGVNTVIVFAGAFAKQQLGFEIAELLGLMALVQVTALLGSLAMAAPTDRHGPKRIVMGTLAFWVVVVVAAAFVESRPAFWVVAVLAGLGLGSIQASSRAFMSRLVPEGREAEFFGFYALCGKTGAIAGPFLFAQLTLLLDARAAVLSIAGFYLAGLILVARVSVGARA